MNPLPWWVKPLAVASLLVVVFSAGMTVESWRRDSGELDEVKDAKSRYTKAVEASEATALKLQTELDRLASTKTVVTKELTRETQRIEYRCVLPASGKALYERARSGDATVTSDMRTERTPPSPTPAP